MYISSCYQFRLYIFGETKIIVIVAVIIFLGGPALSEFYTNNIPEKITIYKQTNLPRGEANAAAGRTVVNVRQVSRKEDNPIVRAR